MPKKKTVTKSKTKSKSKSLLPRGSSKAELSAYFAKAKKDYRKDELSKAAHKRYVKISTSSPVMVSKTLGYKNYVTATKKHHAADDKADAEDKARAKRVVKRKGAPKKRNKNVKSRKGY